MARSQSTSSGATAIGVVLAFIALLLTIPVVAALSIPALGPPLIAAYCLWALISTVRAAAFNLWDSATSIHSLILSPLRALNRRLRPILCS